jgi:cell division protein FtsZ
MSHDAYKREIVLKQWIEKARPDVYKEQEDQWAALRHEVGGENMQRHEEKAQSNWSQRYTDEEDLSSQSSFNKLSQAPHHVDIVVAGVGGGGMNAINHMIHARVRGVRFIAMNTDAQVLAISQAQHRICLGQHHTKGLGAGGNAATGTRAAAESATEIRTALANADLVFIAAGMGGGTGTGAAPVIASIAKKLGALTVGIVTLPFTFEGTRRRRVAEQGLAELNAQIDALITVPNDRLLATVGRDRNLSDAFKIADDVLRQGVQGIAEVINVPGMVNVDFADVRSVLREAGTALMSIGQGQGRNRAQRAAEEAIAGGFLNVTIRGAKRVLFNISGGEDMTLFEVNEVAERIAESIDSSADITFGAVIDPSLQDMLRITLIAAGMEELPTTRVQALRQDQPQPSRFMPRTLADGPPLAPARPATPAQPLPSASQQRTPPVVPPTTHTPPRVRQPGPPTRQQRSLSDLRGIRSMGRRQEILRRQQSTDESDDSIDIPPFLKRYNG